MEICSVTGAVIKTQISSSELQYISISDLDRGMYIIKVKGDDSSFTSKLLVK
ncbi:T9SS type A sorting domain-containing protein [Saccharicrinis aurantiacus]|uniref:T9SS type A sorting domain-containing protein n=1 Tax=Saccharicrinis aurantiacus TaxID=1849719 RepID=UPI0009F86A16